MTDFGAALEVERSRCVHRLQSLRDELASVIEGSRWTTDDDEHDPEGSTIAFERAKIAALIGDAEAELRELDAAAARLAAGTYGDCDRCGTAIPAIRLEALPAARRCVQCVRLR
ncbi:TraR/DksA C4-type zinc finger protein [Rhodococcus fascians]|nr:TraR/DksA C4-type zinc finger protein [Rhodococcus fascians]